MTPFTNKNSQLIFSRSISGNETWISILAYLIIRFQILSTIRKLNRMFKNKSTKNTYLNLLNTQWHNTIIKLNKNLTSIYFPLKLLYSFGIILTKGNYRCISILSIPIIIQTIITFKAMLLIIAYWVCVGDLCWNSVIKAYKLP